MTVAGHDFWFMWGLAHRAYLTECKDNWVLQNFSPRLMIAISWEETQFNNIRQSGFTHIDWMKRWTDIDPVTNAPRKDGDTGQVSGNHAVGYVQVERDTIDVARAQSADLPRPSGFQPRLDIQAGGQDGVAGAYPEAKEVVANDR